jgi:hypothetical protein
MADEIRNGDPRCGSFNSLGITPGRDGMILRASNRDSGVARLRSTV